MVRCPKLILPPVRDGGVTCALMRDVSMVVSMRLHALIFAAGQGVPVVGISYDPKVSGFMDYLDQKNYVTLEEATEENLCGLMDQASSNRFWETKEDSIVRLRELAGQNGDLAWRLLQTSE